MSPVRARRRQRSEHFHKFRRDTPVRHPAGIQLIGFHRFYRERAHESVVRTGAIAEPGQIPLNDDDLLFR